jgi:hypothetical protein
MGRKGVIELMDKGRRGGSDFDEDWNAPCIIRRIV